MKNENKEQISEKNEKKEQISEKNENKFATSFISLKWLQNFLSYYQFDKGFQFKGINKSFKNPIKLENLSGHVSCIDPAKCIEFQPIFDDTKHYQTKKKEQTNIFKTIIHGLSIDFSVNVKMSLYFKLIDKDIKFRIVLKQVEGIISLKSLSEIFEQNSNKNLQTFLTLDADLDIKKSVMKQPYYVAYGISHIYHIIGNDGNILTSIWNYCFKNGFEFLLPAMNKNIDDFLLHSKIFTLNKDHTYSFSEFLLQKYLDDVYMNRSNQLVLQLSNNILYLPFDLKNIDRKDLSRNVMNELYQRVQHRNHEQYPEPKKLFDQNQQNDCKNVKHVFEQISRTELRQEKQLMKTGICFIMNECVSKNVIQDLNMLVHVYIKPIAYQYIQLKNEKLYPKNQLTSENPKLYEKQYAENQIIEYTKDGGLFGGTCTCPDGKIHNAASVINSGCKKMLCEGHTASTCDKHYMGKWSFKKVICGQLIDKPTKSQNPSDVQNSIDGYFEQLELIGFGNIIKYLKKDNDKKNIEDLFDQFFPIPDWISANSKVDRIDDNIDEFSLIDHDLFEVNIKSKFSFQKLKKWVVRIFEKTQKVDIKALTGLFENLRTNQNLFYDKLELFVLENQSELKGEESDKVFESAKVFVRKNFDVFMMDGMLVMSLFREMEKQRYYKGSFF